MPSLDEYRPANYLRAAIIGAPGSGKTWLMGTFPDPGIIDTDVGLTTLVQSSFRKKYPHPIWFASFDDPVDERGIFTEAKSFKEILVQLDAWNRDKQIKTIGVDSATTLSGLVRNAALVTNKATGKSKSYARVTDHATKDTALILTTTEADFGTEIGGVQQVFDRLVQLKKHVVVSFHEREELTDSGIVKRIDPLLTGRVARARFGRWFDEVWYLEVRTDDKGNRMRVLITQPTFQLKTLKSRWGLPAEIENPDYPTILKLLKERGFIPAEDMK